MVSMTETFNKFVVVDGSCLSVLNMIHHSEMNYTKNRYITIIIITIIIIISFMQCIYTYIPETNYVPREYSVTAILLLLFMVLISLVSVLNLLHIYISNVRSMCAVPNMPVFSNFITIVIIIIIVFICHKHFSPYTSIEPTAIPTAQVSSVSPHYFPYYVRCS